LLVLGLIDVVMISNLLVMIIVGGYETFVSRLNLEGHPDEPEWLSHVNAIAADLKFLQRVQLACTRNFKSKSGTRIIELLVPFCFRSSFERLPQ
jgi:hypothetical protein